MKQAAGYACQLHLAITKAVPLLSYFPLDFLHSPPTRRLICYITNDTMTNTATSEGNEREIGEDERGLKERK